jgi:peroxygenase
MSNSITTAVAGVPVTVQRRVPLGLEDRIPQPGIPRANKAISAENISGSPASLAREDYTVLQQHCDFFDRDNDGVLWPWDTYIGFRRLGFGRIISLLAVPFIHGSFSYPSSPSILPDPFFRIWLKNVHRCKHGSDSEVYDTEGRFVPEKFEELFSKYDRNNKGGLDWNDLQNMILGNMNIVDPVGWTAERLEWWTLYLLAADDNGIISKEKIRANYDGSLWYKIADELERKKQMRMKVERAKLH